MEQRDDKQRLHEQLCAYVLGELEGAERAEIENELAKSEELRAERERLEATIGLVQESMAEPAEALSEAALSNVLAAARPEEPTVVLQPKRPWRVTNVARYAAAAAVMIVAAYGFVHFVGPEIATERPEGPVARRQSELNADAGRMRRDAGAPELDALKGLGYLSDEPARPRDLGYSDKNDTEKKSLSGLAVGEGIFEEVDSGSKAPEELVQEVEFEQEPPSESARQKLQDLGRAVGMSEKRAETPREVVAEMTIEPSEPLEELQGLGYLGGAGGSLATTADADGGDNALDAPPTASGPTATGAGSSRTFTVHGGGRRHGGGAAGGAAPSAPATQAGSATTGDTSGFLGQGHEKEEQKPSGNDLNRVQLDNGGGMTWFIDDPYVGQEPGHGNSGDAARVLEETVGGPNVAEFLAANETVQQLYLSGHLGGEEITALLSKNLEAKGFDGRQLSEDDTVDLYRTDPDLLCKQILLHCRRRPQERPRDMFFRFWGDNPFEWAALDALSTFSVDVDTASYSLARRYLASGNVPEKAQVRTEEFVNSFDSGVAPPLEETFAIDLEAAPSFFGNDSERERWMMRVVVKGKEVAPFERDPMALTFVVDNSGSMRSENRLELVKHSLRLLVSQLDANDSIALVSFNNDARLVLPMTSAANGATIETAIQAMTPNGGTNAEAGLKFGYAHAYDSFTEGAQNRVIFLSDGVANIGQTDQDRLNEEVAGFRERGIYLNTIGVGLGNHNDVFLEQLADKGDGLCDYIDTPRQAKKALVDNFTGALQTIARDVKIQVEFDPKQVSSYRLLGYENRAIADKDFRNDAVDAGEVGAGHQVTALYEIEPASSVSSELPLATVRVRYKEPHGRVAKEEAEFATEIERTLPVSNMASEFAATTVGYRRAVLVAQFAEFLRRSVHARGDSFDRLVAEARELAPVAKDDDFTEFVQLLERSRELIVAHLPRYDALSLAIDEVRRNHYLRARIEDLPDQRPELLQEIADQNRALEEKLRQLLQQELGPDPK